MGERKSQWGRIYRQLQRLKAFSSLPSTPLAAPAVLASGCIRTGVERREGSRSREPENGGGGATLLGRKCEVSVEGL